MTNDLEREFQNEITDIAQNASVFELNGRLDDLLHRLREAEMGMTKAELRRLVKDRKAAMNDEEELSSSDYEQWIEDRGIFVWDPIEGDTLAIKRMAIGTISNNVAVLNEFNNFRQFNQTPRIGDEAMVDFWIQDPDRLILNKATINPTQPRIFGNCLNLWQGYGVDMVEGDTTNFHNYFKALVSSEKEAEWLLSWMAHKIRYPTAKMGSAPVLVSSIHGTGKSTICRIMSTILGNHAITINDSKKLTGRFAAFSEETCLVVVEEALYSGNKAGADFMKSMVADDNLTVEAKFQMPKAIKSNLGFMFTSNHDHVLHLEESDRRYSFIDVNDTMVGKTEYWNAFNLWLKNGGYAAIAHELYHKGEAEKFNTDEAIKTTQKARNVLASLEGPRSWYYQCLNLGIIRDETGAPLEKHENGSVSKNDLYEAFVYWHNKERSHKSNKPASRVAFFMQLAPFVNEAPRPRMGKKNGGRRVFLDTTIEGMEKLWAEYGVKPTLEELAEMRNTREDEPVLKF